jgi:GSH-dependent disulfide-bond oxidoreductase
MTSQTLPIDLYYWNTSNGYKISILLEELGVPYTVHFVNIKRGEQFTPEFLAISPNNRIPAIVDPEGPDGKPISIFESGAIMLYLARKFGQLLPADERGRVLVEQWLMWQVGGFGPMLGQNHHFAIYAPEKIPYPIKRYRDETHRLYGVLEKQLMKGEWVAGDYSVADIAIFGWARGWQRQGIEDDEFPTVMAWLARMWERPAVKRGMAVTPPTPDVDLSKDKEAQKILFNQRAT